MITLSSPLQVSTGNFKAPLNNHSQLCRSLFMQNHLPNLYFSKHMLQFFIFISVYRNWQQSRAVCIISALSLQPPKHNYFNNNHHKTMVLCHAISFIFLQKYFIKKFPSSSKKISISTNQLIFQRKQKRQGKFGKESSIGPSFNKENKKSSLMLSAAATRTCVSDRIAPFGEEVAFDTAGSFGKSNF